MDIIHLFNLEVPMKIVTSLLVALLMVVGVACATPADACPIRGTIVTIVTAPRCGAARRQSRRAMRQERRQERRQTRRAARCSVAVTCAAPAEVGCSG